MTIVFSLNLQEFKEVQEKKDVPMVAECCSSKEESQNCLRTQVLPTWVSPTSTTLYTWSYSAMDNHQQTMHKRYGIPCILLWQCLDSVRGRNGMRTRRRRGQLNFLTDVKTLEELENALGGHAVVNATVRL